MSTLIDFRKVNQDPFFLTKPYGKPAPWPSDKPANFFFKPYGHASNSIPDLKDATLVISPPGAPFMSDKFVLPSPGEFDMEGGRQLGNWFTDEWRDLKTYSTTHPAATMFIWGGMVVLALKAMRFLK